MLAVGGEYLKIVAWNFVPSGIVFVSSSMFQALGNTIPSLVSSIIRTSLLVIPAYLMSRTSGFALHWIWYLSVAVVAIHMTLNVLLLRREYGRKLAFAGGRGSARGGGGARRRVTAPVTSIRACRRGLRGCRSAARAGCRVPRSRADNGRGEGLIERGANVAAHSDLPRATATSSRDCSTSPSASRARASRRARRAEESRERRRLAKPVSEIVASPPGSCSTTEKTPPGASQPATRGSTAAGSMYSSSSAAWIRSRPTPPIRSIGARADPGRDGREPRMRARASDR